MSTTLSSDLLGQRQQRIENMKKLQDLGIDPYPSRAQKDHSNLHITTHYEALEGNEITVAGRLTSKREHGKLIFGDILDASGQIQIAVKKDEIKEDLKKSYLGWEQLKFIDVGDIVQITGTLGKTQQGQITLFVQFFKLLTKAIRPIPTELKDKEVIYRQRYLDLILHPEKIEHFKKVAQVTFAIREFLNSKGFLEIKTPILQPVYGGTLAKPFTTHVNALSTDYYLAISHELYLKRLITAGFENVYNLVGYFRNEGIDRSHNPEFTMIETMTAYQNYEYNMNLIEEMYLYIAKKVFNKTKFEISGETVDFSKPWLRISMLEAIKKYTNYDFNETKTLEEAHQILEELNLEERPHSIGECMKVVFEEKVEEHLIQPTFVTGHPVEISPLAKAMDSDPRFVERFEIFIGGMEGGDNWTELNNPLELYERFKTQHEQRKKGNDEAHPTDIEFIEMMEYGMPPTTGLGPGIERLTMMLTGTQYIDDIIFFPLMRPLPPTKIQKELYGEIIHTAEAKETKQQEQHITNKNNINMSTLPTREHALQLLEEHVKEPYQILHAKMVATAMELYAKRFGANENLWYITGLLHDVDYQEFPAEHPNQSLQWFSKWEYPEELIHAVAAHAYSSGRTVTEPSRQIDFALIACDELSGLLYAYSLMKPDKFKGMEASSALKKYKNKGFAAKIDREEIQLGVTGLNIELQEHIQNLINVFERMEEFKS